EAVDERHNLAVANDDDAAVAVLAELADLGNVDGAVGPDRDRFRALEPFDERFGIVLGRGGRRGREQGGADKHETRHGDCPWEWRPVRPLLWEGKTAKQGGCLPSARRDNERNQEASLMTRTIGVVVLLAAVAGDLNAQTKPYNVFPAADPPYYRVR